MSLRAKHLILLPTFTALGLSSCAVKDGQLDFTWWKDAAAPVMEDDVIIESGGSGYYRSAPAPARVPLASIPKDEPETQQPPAPQPTPPKQVAAQQQPATTAPPAPAPRRKPQIAQNKPGIHIVQPGDTLSAIARRYGTSVKALVAHNGMASAEVPLKIKQELKLPVTTQAPAAPAPAATQAAPQPAPVQTSTAAPQPAPAPAPGGTYTVQAGDTIYKISRKFGVAPSALMQANGLTLETANTIRVGAILQIPKAQ